MLVDQLAVAYKFHSCIGNSIDLKKMIHEVLKTFVSESYAIYGEFCIFDEKNNYEKIDSFGKIDDFNAIDFLEYKQPLQMINNKNHKILKMNLEKGSIFLVSTNLDVDCSFFYSMFESLVHKLNLSVNACINYEELKKSHEKLEKQQIELINANKTKDDFLANISHELKTPLNSITVISSIMSKNANNILDDKQLKNIKIIKKCADDLNNLINDILDISKLEAGELKIYKEKIDLRDIVEELYDSLSPVATQKGIVLNKNVQGDNFIINSDSKRINQILKNLLSNAIKFTSFGEVSITLSKKEDGFYLDVKDSGIGIDKSHLEHIFDRFKQVDNSRTRKYNGTGLGLAISNELATLLGAKLSVQSEINIGSIFSFFIPLNSEINLKKEEKFDYTNELNEIQIESKSAKNAFDDDIILMLADNILQFKLSVALKKESYKIHLILDSSKLKDELLKIDTKKRFFAILDSNLLNFDEILQDFLLYKDNLILITNSDIDYDIDLVLLEDFEIEKIKYILNTK